MKNYDPLVSGPALAIDNNPALSCNKSKFSSANLGPYILLPPCYYLFLIFYFTMINY